MRVNAFLATALIVTALSIPSRAHADTVEARCSVYPKGEDRASWYGACTFSQRQGVTANLLPAKCISQLWNKLFHLDKVQNHD